MNIHMDGIVLTGAIQWARYWSLKSLQCLAPCTEIELHTCPLSIKFRWLSSVKAITMRGACAGRKFCTECHLFMQAGLEVPSTTKRYFIDYIIVQVDGESKKFHSNEIPGYPQNGVTYAYEE